MLSKLKLIFGAIIIIAAISATAYVCGLRTENESLKAKYEQEKKDREAYQAALKYESDAREIAEKTLSKRIKEQERIAKESEARLQKKDAELAELRKKYAEVDHYLNIPVPHEYLIWLREKINE